MGDNEKLIGCLVYGFPVGARAALSISEQLTKDNVLELTRLYCDDGYGANIESYAIGQSFKWFRENDKAIKVLSVNTMNREGKRKRTAIGFGKRKDTKRAIVHVAAGQRIDIFGGPVS